MPAQEQPDVEELWNQAHPQSRYHSNPTLDNDFGAPHLQRFRALAALQTSTARDHWYCLIDVKIQKVQLVDVKHQEY